MLDELLKNLITKEDLLVKTDHLKLFSESSLNKVAGGHYPNDKFIDFPPPVKIGSRVYWHLPDVERWIKLQIEKATQKNKELTPKRPFKPFVGAGRPTRREEDEARLSGFESVKAYRAHLHAMQVAGV